MKIIIKTEGDINEIKKRKHTREYHQKQKLVLWKDQRNWQNYS